MKYKIQPYSIHELGQRENQEDSLFPAHGKATNKDRIFILCDGMGGHEKGEVASATVCETISKTILSHWNPYEFLSDGLVLQAIDAAYDALDAKDDCAEKKMGTTLTLLCLHANGATIAHIGDSRVYQFRPRQGVVFRTQDHSLVNDLIKIGEITDEEAKTHPQKNVITRAMQPHQEHRAKADIVHLTDIQSGDYFFLCSDGMLEQTSDENLVNIITKLGVSDKEKVERLRKLTEDNKDNHTAHIIHIIDKVEGKQSSQGGIRITVDLPKRKRSPLLYIIIGVVAIAILATAIFTIWNKFGGQSDKDSVKIDTVYIEVRDAGTVKKETPKPKKSHAMKEKPQLQEVKPTPKTEKKPLTMPKVSKPEAKEKESESTDSKKNNNDNLKQEDDHATTDQGNASAWKHI